MRAVGFDGHDRPRHCVLTLRAEVATANASGASSNINTYGPFGESAQATPDNNRFGYTGQQQLKGLELYYYKARVYSPALGRFLQADPIGYADDLNLYGYVGNSPINATDPQGLAADWLKGSALATGLSGFGSALRDRVMSGETAGDIARYGVTGALTDMMNVPLGGMALGVKAVGSVAAKGVATGAESVVNGLKLNKSLASQAQMGEVGITLAGPGVPVVFRDAARVAKEHGGNAVDWMKKSSSSRTARDGATFETHWVENVKTGQQVEFKTNFLGGN